MPLNDALTSSLRTPQLSVLAEGTPLPNVIEADVLANAHFAAARFRLRLALDPATATALLQPGSVLDFQLSLDGAPTSLLQGEADTIRMDVLNRIVEIDGRDLTHACSMPAPRRRSATRPPARSPRP